MSAAVATASVGMRALAVLGRCVRAPLRVLVRARDLYVSQMAACASGGRGPVGMVAVPRSQGRGFNRSAGDDDTDVRELIRAASRARPAASGGVGPRRSHSVAAIGRIDEDRPCEFGVEEDGACVLGPRSKSCDVGPSARTTARARRAAVAA